MLDKWWTQEVLPRLKGKAILIRYADDFTIGFELEEDARRVHAVLPKRFGKYGLTLYPEKTRLLRFGSRREQRSSRRGSLTCATAFNGVRMSRDSVSGGVHLIADFCGSLQILIQKFSMQILYTIEISMKPRMLTPMKLPVLLGHQFGYTLVKRDQSFE